MEINPILVNRGHPFRKGEELIASVIPPVANPALTLDTQAACRCLYVMGNAPHLEGIVIRKRACTKQAEAYLAKQMRVIAAPSIIQNGF